MHASLTRFFLPLVAITATLHAQTDDALAGLMQYQSGANILPLRHFEERARQAIHDPATQPALEADLVRVLAGNTPFEAKRFACQQLAVIGRAPAVPALAALLKQEETAGIACDALVQIPSPDAAQALRTALATAPARAQTQIALALGVRQDTAAAGDLSTLALGPDPSVAEAAIIALGKIPAPAAQQTLATLRQQSPDTLRRAVANSSFLVAERLATQGDPKAATGIYETYLAAGQPDDLRRAAFCGLIRLDPDGGEKRAMAALNGDDPILRPAAIAAIPDMKDVHAPAAFARALPSLQPAEQALLVQALAQSTHAPARAAIETQLGSAHPEVRTAAVTALGHIGDASTVAALGQAVRNASQPAELKAIELALAGLQGGTAVDRALAAQVVNRMAGPKTPFLGALVRRANPVSAPLFLAHAASPDPAIAKLAFQGLSRVATLQQLPGVLDALTATKPDAVLPEAQASVGQLLQRLGKPGEGSAAIRAALQKAPPTTGPAALMPLLALCPDPAGLAEVERAAQSTDPALRDLGLRTLADWPDPAAGESLFALYKNAPGDKDRVIALRGLTRLLGEQNAHPNAALIRRYSDLLGGAQGDNDRKLVLGTLAGCAHPDALGLAVSQLSHPGSRAEAELAVKKIAEAIKAQHPQAAADALQKLGTR